MQTVKQIFKIERTLEQLTFKPVQQNAVEVSGYGSAFMMAKDNEGDWVFVDVVPEEVAKLHTDIASFLDHQIRRPI